MRQIICFAIAVMIMAAPLHAAQSIAVQKTYYQEAKNEIEAMLEGKAPLSYERAIFLIENAWWDNQLDYKAYRKIFDLHVENVLALIRSNKFDASYKANVLESAFLKDADFNKAHKDLVSNWAIYSYMTNTNLFQKDGKTRYSFPTKYSYSDPLGTVDWTNTQVMNVLNTGKGNCFALTSTFKILADRLKTDANICTAPNHIYITHKNEYGTPYNLELSNGMFVGTGTLGTLTYTTNEAIRNNIALRELDIKQSITLCLVYLGKGYEYKFGKQDHDFPMSCAESAIKYDKHNLNAMLLRAEILEDISISKHQPVDQLQSDKTFRDYQSLVGQLYSLGYREMPLEMKNILIKGWIKDTLTQLFTKSNAPEEYNHSGIPNTRYASLSWGLFDEEIQFKPIERFGRTLFDARSKKIMGFKEAEKLYNDYNFDPVAFAWNVDPLAHKIPHSSPYAFCEGNPISYKDPDGRIRIQYNKELLASEGVTKLQMARFESIVNNISNLVSTNPAVMDAIVNTTGFTPERIMKDLSRNAGPELYLVGGITQRGDKSGIVFGMETVKALGSSDKDVLSKQVLGVAMGVLHEYGHYGDNTTNGGKHSGQYTYNGKTAEFDADLGDRDAIKNGSQKWFRSLTGHRGNDIEVMGFGRYGLVKKDGSISFEESGLSPYVKEGSVSNPPTELPSNAQGTNILNTLDVR